MCIILPEFLQRTKNGALTRGKKRTKDKVATMFGLVCGTNLTEKQKNRNTGGQFGETLKYGVVKVLSGSTPTLSITGPSLSDISCTSDCETSPLKLAELLGAQRILVN